MPGSKRDSGWQPWAYNKPFEPTARLRLAAAQLHRCIASGLSLFRNGPEQWGKGEELQFKIRALLENAASIGEGPDFRCYDVAKLLGPHLKDYLYFAASIFWRASALPWCEYRGQEQFSLGTRYDEEFRVYLLGQAGFPRNGLTSPPKTTAIQN